jgi:hypothetical protein
MLITCILGESVRISIGTSTILIVPHTFSLFMHYRSIIPRYKARAESLHTYTMNKQAEPKFPLCHGKTKKA